MENSTSGNNNKKNTNKYDNIICILRICNGMRITNGEIKISRLKAILKKYVLRAVLKDVRLCMFLIYAERLFHSLGAAD